MDYDAITLLQIVRSGQNLVSMWSMTYRWWHKGENRNRK